MKRISMCIVIYASNCKIYTIRKGLLNTAYIQCRISIITGTTRRNTMAQISKSKSWLNLYIVFTKFKISKNALLGSPTPACTVNPPPPPFRVSLKTDYSIFSSYTYQFINALIFMYVYLWSPPPPLSHFHTHKNMYHTHILFGLGVSCHHQKSGHKNSFCTRVQFLKVNLSIK